MTPAPAAAAAAAETTTDATDASHGMYLLFSHFDPTEDAALDHVQLRWTDKHCIAFHVLDDALSQMPLAPAPTRESRSQQRMPLRALLDLEQGCVYMAYRAPLFRTPGLLPVPAYAPAADLVYRLRLGALTDREGRAVSMAYPAIADTDERYPVDELLHTRLFLAVRALLTHSMRYRTIVYRIAARGDVHSGPAPMSREAFYDGVRSAFRSMMRSMPLTRQPDNPFATITPHPAPNVERSNVTVADATPSTLRTALDALSSAGSAVTSFASHMLEADKLGVTFAPIACVALANAGVDALPWRLPDGEAGTHATGADIVAAIGNGYEGPSGSVLPGPDPGRLVAAYGAAVMMQRVTAGRPAPSFRGIGAPEGPVAPGSASSTPASANRTPPSTVRHTRMSHGTGTKID